MHRAGEGAPYAGLKPAGAKIDPAIAAVDKAVETESIESLSKTVRDEVEAGLKIRFKEVLARKKFATKDVEAGRKYVAAYVELMHYAEGIHNTVAGVFRGHGQETGHDVDDAKH